MKMENFEEQLIHMSKPKISELKHQDMLANYITKAKDKSVLSLWWLSIPLFIMAALIMKTLFMPYTSFISNLHEVTGKEKYISFFFFFIVPVVFIFINAISMRRIYFLSGNPKVISFLAIVWFHIIIIMACLFTIIIYFI